MNGVRALNNIGDGQPIDHGLADQGHHRRVARPHGDDEGVIADAEGVAAQIRSESQPFGTRGQARDLGISVEELRRQRWGSKQDH